MLKKLILTFCSLLFITTLYTEPILNSPYLKFTKENVPASYQSNPSSYPSTMITQGKEVYTAIASDNAAQFKKNSDTYIQSIIALMFYFYSKAIEKNQGFSNGAFVIKDPGFKVYSFLYGFVESKWKPRDMYKEINIDISSIGAYPRQSTHLNDYYKYTNKTESGWLGTNKKKEFTHYGIDLPKGYELPTLKQHILFGKEETKPALTYIKIEDHGLGTSGVLKHTEGLLKSQARKFVTKASEQYKKFKVNSYYLSQLMNNMSNALGSDDSPDSRRERVPAEIAAEFFALLLSEGSAASKKEVDENAKRIKALGIQGMIALLDAYGRGSAGSAAWKTEVRKLAQKLRNNYDHLDIRIGREVILAPEQELK